MSVCNLNGQMSLETNNTDGRMTICVDRTNSERIINISEIVGSIGVCVPNVDYIRVLWYVYGTNVVTIDNKFFGYVIFK